MISVQSLFHACAATVVASGCNLLACVIPSLIPRLLPTKSLGMRPYLAISGEDLATYVLSNLTCSAHATVDSDKSCCVP